MWIQQDIKQKTDMLDREDEGVSTGDQVYEEEEDAITTMTDASGAVSLVLKPKSGKDRQTDCRSEI